MRILLTNDDGIDAPGLEALAVAAARLGRACVVVAPVDPHSGCGHRVTTDRPLRVIPAGPGRFAVTGTPSQASTTRRTIVPTRSGSRRSHEPLWAFSVTCRTGQPKLRSTTLT